MATPTSSRRGLVLVPGPETTSRAAIWRVAGHSPLAGISAFEAAWAQGQDRRDHPQSGWGAAGALILIDACYRDFRGFRLWHERLIRSAEEVPAAPDAEWELLVGAARAMASGHVYDGGHAETVDSRRILRLLRQSADPDAALYAASAMIVFLDATRRDKEATQFEVSAEPFEAGAGPWSRGHWYSIRGQHALFFQRLDEAAELLDRAAAIAHAEAIGPLLKMTAIMQVRLAIARGEHAAVTPLLARCEPLDDEREPMWRAAVLQLQALALLCTGKYHDALHCAHRATAFAQRAAAPPDEAAQMVVLEAYCLVAIGDGAAAGTIFRQAADQTSGQQARVVNLLANLADADTAMQRGDHDTGLSTLTDAVKEMRALEYGAFFWPLPDVAARLCAHALAWDIEPEYMRSIVRQRGLVPPRNAPAHWPWSMSMRALGRNNVEVGGLTLRSARKSQAKPLELLDCVVALGGSAVSIDRITQLLWRGEGREGASSAFAVTLHRLRGLLGDTPWLTVSNGRLTLDPDRVWIDHRALRNVLDDMDGQVHLDQVETELDTMLALYTGPLLADNSAAWAVAARLQLRMRIDAVLARCAVALPPARRRAVLARALAADPELPLAAGLLAAC